HLLPSAGLIKIHNEIWIFRSEIRGRIVERDVPIFPNPQERQVERRRRQPLAHLATHRKWIGGVAVEQVIVHNSGLAHYPSHRHPAETTGMSRGQANILVEGKSLHLGQSISGALVSAFRNSSCEAAVAATMRAYPRSAIARRIAVAACPAAARPTATLSLNTRSSIANVSRTHQR